MKVLRLLFVLQEDNEVVSPITGCNASIEVVNGVMGKILRL